YPQHSYQLPTMCSMILLNKAIQEPFPLKYSLDEIMTALLNSHNMGNNISSVTNISTNNLEFILNTPTSSNDRLHAFLDSSKLILKGQPAIIIGSNPTVQETELIVKHYGAKHVFTFVLEAGILDHREVLSALGGWIMRDHYINQIK
ncbi:MAG: hypothetical protein ACPG5T_04645, partial [Endozoicomonas sp.]